jgi:hypothetical protein
MSAQPAISKNGKSYYRLITHNKISGMVFQLTEKLFPGMVIDILSYQQPFLKIEIVK